METKTLNFSELVPQEVANSSKANLSANEINLLGALCHNYISSKSEWFSVPQNTLFEQAGVSKTNGNRLLDKLVEKNLIERKKGTNGKTTKYKLHPAITDLLEHGTQDGTMNGTQDGTMELRDGTQNVSEMEDGAEELVISEVVKVGDEKPADDNMLEAMEWCANEINNLPENKTKIYNITPSQPKAPVTFDDYCDDVPFGISRGIGHVDEVFDEWEAEIDECATLDEIMKVADKFNSFHNQHLKTAYNKRSVALRQKELQLKGWFQDSLFYFPDTETIPMFEFVTKVTEGVPADKIMGLQEVVDKFIDETEACVHKWCIKKIAERRLKKISRQR